MYCRPNGRERDAAFGDWVIIKDLKVVNDKIVHVPVREQLKELTKQYDKSENDLKALQSVGQVSIRCIQDIIMISDSSDNHSYKISIVQILRQRT